jgi:hypothetical protein
MIGADEKGIEAPCASIGVMQDVARWVPDNTMQAANDVAKHMTQERREGFGGSMLRWARPRSKAWPIDRHRVELRGEPLHERTHFATRGGELKAGSRRMRGLPASSRPSTTCPWHDQRRSQVLIMTLSRPHSGLAFTRFGKWPMFFALRDAYLSRSAGLSEESTSEPLRQIVSPCLRPKLHSMEAVERTIPETCLPSWRSNEGVQGTRLNPSPSSIIAKRPEARSSRCRYVPATGSPSLVG